MRTPLAIYKNYVSKRDAHADFNWTYSLAVIFFAFTVFSLRVKADDRSKTEADGVCVDCVVTSLNQSNSSNQFKDFKAINVAIFSADPSGQSFIDPRQPIDTSNPDNRQLSAIGLIAVSANLDVAPPNYTGKDSKQFKSGDKVTSDGSGFLINDCLVITNHHVVNEQVPADKVKNRQIIFYARNQSSDTSNPVIKSTGKVVAEGPYTGGKDINNDWAIIKLDKALGRQVGHIGPIIADTNDASRIPVSSASFYADKKGNGMQLWEQKKCQILGEDAQNKNTWLTDCPAIPGASGSPVFAQNPENKQIFALGIIQSETSAANANKVTYKNANNMVPFSKAFTKEQLQKIIDSNQCGGISI